MPELFDVKPVDQRFYQERLADFLPDRIVDVHAHVWLTRFRADSAEAYRRAVTWPSRVARDNPIEDLAETYRLMLPGKRVSALIFSNLMSHEDDFEAGNAYVSRSAADYGMAGLIWSSPRWSAEELEAKIGARGFLGAKSYLSLADPAIGVDDISIFDFYPRHQLEALDRRGAILMLHIPRNQRLRDSRNLAELLEIERRYPRLQVIVAHVGRAYCPEDIGDAFDVLAETRHMTFDISANTSAQNFEKLIRAVGPKRILFGTDLPITRMRMRRICENGTYVNLVPKGLYGDVSGDRNMREVENEEAERLTFFLYEEIDAFRSAAEATGLSSHDIEDVFCGNAMRMIAQAKERIGS